MKYLFYQKLLAIQRVFWRLAGFRRISSFGHSFKLSPLTVFPSYRKLRLPSKGYMSDIVRYGDFVQFHAICSQIDMMKDTPVIVDVGAHHGAYAVVIGKIIAKHGGKVLAIEPNPISFEILVDNVKKNDLEDVVTCIPVAVSDRCGNVTISLEDSQSSISNFREVDNQVNVPALTLTNILAENYITHVSLLLVDVEGAELPVLRGLPWDSIPVESIFCEMHPYAWPQFGYDGEAIAQYLESRGLRCVDMYLREWPQFDVSRYIGPCLLMKK